MPKMKTHKGLKKRVRVTARGRIKVRTPGKRKLMSHKSGDRRRRLGQPTVLASNFEQTIRRALCVD